MESQTLDGNLIKPQIKLSDKDVASTGKRFANYFIDRVATYVLAFLLGMAMASGGLLNEYDRLLAQVIGLLVVLIYYLIMEAATGKTIGKMITRTKVVTEDGAVPDFRIILIRTLCRLIPFEAFSFLGSSSVGWHDSISKSRVVDED